jgi:hypothetical protein
VVANPLTISRTALADGRWVDAPKLGVSKLAAIGQVPYLGPQPALMTAWMDEEHARCRTPASLFCSGIGKR